MNDKLKEVSLTEMLDAREARAFAQKQLLNRYGKPLICLTLNIPGPVKVLPGVPQAFEEACKRIVRWRRAKGCSFRTGKNAQGL